MASVETKTIKLAGKYTWSLLFGPLKGPYKKTIKRTYKTKVDVEQFTKVVADLTVKQSVEAGSSAEVGKIAKVNAKSTFSSTAHLEVARSLTTKTSVEESLEVTDTFEIPAGETRTVYCLVYHQPGVIKEMNVFSDSPGDVPVEIEVEVKVPKENIFKDRLDYHEALSQGQLLKSWDGRYMLLMQSDGNLVGYSGDKAVPAAAFWSTGTHGEGRDNCKAVLQGDGNFVVYNKHGKALWASDTHGSDAHHLVIQCDRNIVLYNFEGKPVWASGTNI